MWRPERRLWFKLAMLLGKSVKQAQEEISSAEFAEWLAFFNLEPMPDSWTQHGQLMTMIARAMGDKAAQPEQFIPKVRRKIQTPDQIKQMGRLMALCHNQRVATSGDNRRNNGKRKS